MPCEPPRLGRREARDLLANKTVAFVGDSVSRMMFCETAAWLFGVKGWWWQNRWVPGRATWSPSLWNNSGAIIAAGCGFGNLLDCRNGRHVDCTRTVQRVRLRYLIPHGVTIDWVRTRCSKVYTKVR